MICQEIRENLSAYLDRELPEEIMTDMARHLQDCPGCLAEKERLAEVMNLVTAMEIPLLSKDMVSPVIDAINAEELKANKIVFNIFELFLAASFGVLGVLLLTPTGKLILSFIRIIGRIFLETGTLMIKFLTRLNFGTQGWPVIISLFAGIVLSYWVLKRMVNNANLGGALHE